MISAIAALGKNRVLGKNNELLWHIPDDLKRLRMLTEGHALIMGRKTFDSILAVRKAPLPNRTSLVITRDPSWHYEGALVAHSVEEAIEKAKQVDQKEIFIFGGAQIYEEALPYTDRLYLTLIDDQKDGDVYFPPYETTFTKIISDETRKYNGLSYRWVTLEK